MRRNVQRAIYRCQRRNRHDNSLDRIELNGHIAIQ